MSNASSRNLKPRTLKRNLTKVLGSSVNIPEVSDTHFFISVIAIFLCDNTFCALVIQAF